MDEQIIADRLRQTIPQAPEPVAPEAPRPMTSEQSSVVQDGVSEYSLLKVGNTLGLEMPSSDDNEKLKYIFEMAVRDSGKTDLDTVILQIKDYMFDQGIAYAPDRFMKLWLYLRLRTEKQAIDTEMEGLRGGW